MAHRAEQQDIGTFLANFYFAYNMKGLLSLLTAILLSVSAMAASVNLTQEVNI